MNNFAFISNQNDYADLQSALRHFDGWMLLMDENTQKHCRPIFLNAGFQPDVECVVESGEKTKNLPGCEKIWQILTDAGAGRNYAIVNLGGGVICDLGGFAASCYKRGIAYFNVPTTLLSMVDAAHGGKTGVNYNGLKNQIGQFQEAEMVFVDPGFLLTLPDEELISGYAEVLKHALIADDEYWTTLKAVQHPKEIADWLDIIVRSVEIKTGIVAADPHEKGQRKLLNFGHNIGHALESLYNEHLSTRLSHGRAVAAGMICEARIAFDKGYLSDADLREIIDVNLLIFGKTSYDSSMEELFLSYLRQDKKNSGDAMNFTLLEKIGKGLINQHVSAAEVRSAMAYYTAL